ncbi:hypothetical protein [Yinghuangia seranimata]|uniref:hypothetical protein n=1 Tax=Yinghuangia seranimata TaxID=408067 RepID=UPI00248CCA86|nr:hypothetical protein [Yinghuangia seranimata]MDI2124882.1 hypothetical protein [Yinghuangia seranimata]
MRNLPLLHRTRMARTITGTAALAMASALMLTACGGGDSGGKKDDKVASLGDKGGSQSPGAVEKAAGEKGDMVKYAGCMRDHGIDMPDPSSDGSMMAQAIPADSGDNKKMEDASNACRKWLPNGGEVSEKDKAEQREQSLKMARCLREHGMNVPDPGSGEGLAIDMGADKDKADAAFKACAPNGAGGVTVTR